MKNTNLIIVGVAALLIGAGAGFFGGMQYQKGQTPTRTGANGTFTRGAGRLGGANGNNSVIRGQIISADNNSITVKLADGSTKIVILGSSTMIGKSTTGSTTDLTNGSTVTVVGATNSDGSVTAQNVEVGNAVMFGGPRPSGSPAPSSAPQGY